MTATVLAKALRGVALTVTCMLASACATEPASSTADGEAAAQAPDTPAITDPVNSTRSKAIASYRDYLARYPDSPEYDEVTRRLADLLVEQAADKQLATAASPEVAKKLQAQAIQSYAAAISHYEYLLEKNPQGPESTALLYQLARAYQESGQAQQALAAIDSLLTQGREADRRLYADTRFRQGELLFAQGDYRRAANAYQAVVDLGVAVPAYEQSLYKLGWSLFKKERYQDALPVLFASLEQTIGQDMAYATQWQGLTPGDREQAADLLRVISRCFAQLGGVDAVDLYFTQHGQRAYKNQIVLALADWYVEQEQVSEAASTWLALAQANPLSAQAPRLTSRAISLYQKAGFQRRRIELQERFVLTYGMASDFWKFHSPEDFPDTVAQLQSSLQELSRFAHVQADETGDANQVREAEQWYRDYLAWFSDKPDAAEMNFQLAELLYDHGHYQLAWDEYERTAWSRGSHARTTAAALGAQHASAKVLQLADTAQQPALTKRATAGALRFVASYPAHRAAPGLLVRSGTVLLEQQQYDRALNSSEQVIAATSASTDLRQVAWSLRAQALFAIADYAGAAAAYREALQLASKDDERRPALQAGLASATYQQASQALASGDLHRAAVLYRQTAQLTPDPAIQSTALFDAATTLLAIESWPEAVELLQQYRNDHPDAPLQGAATQKLAYAYERSGAYSTAADEYLRLARDQRQPQALQREALLRAAELYRQTGATQRAILASERYLQRFPEPAAVAVDVMQQLAAMELGDTQRRQHWLRAIIKLDRRTDSATTAEPAAEAALELAEQQLAAFRRIDLVAPVQEHLAQKIAAMKAALAAFEAAIGYGIYPVTTAATYHIASMYDELGRALLASERPTSLTVAERAEYEVLLAQQAAPFEQQAITIYRSNVQRSGSAQRDTWVEKSERQLDELQRGR